VRIANIVKGLDTSTAERLRPTARAYGAAAAVLAGVLALVFATKAGRGTATETVASLAQAQPRWLLAAGAAFVAGLLCSAAAWRSGLRACGSVAGYTDVSARYAVGSLVNAVAPAHLGGAVRLALLSQTLPGRDRLWRAGGIGALVAGARALALAGLVVIAALWGEIPLWPAPVMGAAVLLGLALLLTLGPRATGRLGSLLEVFRMLRKSPREGAGLLGWIGVSFAARLAAAAAIAAALGLPAPVWSAFVLVTAIALAGIIPLTPGNFGAGAGAATLALHGTGIGVGTSLAAGVAFQAVETVAGMGVGLLGAAVIAAPGSRVRRLSFAAAGAGAILVAAAIGVASIDLV
jgi:uncharacterized membrane protein YbhN (UPF0104 family)